MRGVLPAYVRWRVLTHTAALAASLTALMQVLELLDVTTEILDRRLGIAGLLHYAWLRAPGELVSALPLAALLGAISAFHELSKNNEMIPIRAAGISLKRLVVYLLPVSLLVALTQLVVSQSLVPLAEPALKSWWDSTAPPEQGRDPGWVRTSTGLVSYAAAVSEGRQLTGVRIYVRGEDGLLSARVSTSAARWDGRRWQLEQVEELRVSGGEVLLSAEAARPWQSNLQPDDVQRVDIARPQLSSIMLVDVISGRRVATQPFNYYQTALYRSFTAPLAAFIMLLLALPAASGLPRDSGWQGLVIGLVLGLAFLVCDGLMAALGTSGRVPALAAALAAPALFAAIGLLQLAARERR